MRIKEIINNPQFKYVIVTFIISSIGFIKTFVLMKIFDFDKLGIIALAQTFTSSISLMQIGVISGGYRLFSYKKESILEKINATVLFFFLFLIVLLCLFGIIFGSLFDTGMPILQILFFIIIGVSSLYSNWVICKLLGKKYLIIVNKVQIASAIISLVVIVSAKWFGMPAVLLGLFLQPMVIIGLAYFAVPQLIPSISYEYFRKYIKKIIFLGFIPYLTAAFTLLNSQLGRWFITISLGTFMLGKTFLPSLFVVLASVFPGAMSNLFFPKIIESYESKNNMNVNTTLKRYFIILLLYYILVFVITIFFAKILINAFLPKQIESVNLIFAILPSLIFIHLSGPSIFLFNAAKKFNHILIGGLVSVISYSGLLLLYLYFSKPQLIWFFAIESISAFFFFMYNIFYFIKLNNSVKLC